MIFDFNIALVFILTLASLIICIVYGVLNWNKNDKRENGATAHEEAWTREEKKIEDEISGEINS